MCPPGDWMIIIDAPRYETREADIKDIHTAETRIVNPVYLEPTPPD